MGGALARRQAGVLSAKHHVLLPAGWSSVAVETQGRGARGRPRRPRAAGRQPRASRTTPSRTRPTRAPVLPRARCAISCTLFEARVSTGSWSNLLDMDGEMSQGASGDASPTYEDR